MQTSPDAHGPRALWPGCRPQAPLEPCTEGIVKQHENSHADSSLLEMAFPAPVLFCGWGVDTRIFTGVCDDPVRALPFSFFCGSTSFPK